MSPIFSFPFRYNELASPALPSSAKLSSPREELREKQINSPPQINSDVEKSIVLPRTIGCWKESYPSVVTDSPTLNSPIGHAGYRLPQTANNVDYKSVLCSPKDVFSGVYNHYPVHPLQGDGAICVKYPGVQESVADREKSPTGITTPESLFKVSRIASAHILFDILVSARGQ